MRYVFVVMYFIFVICLSVFAVVITIVVLHLHLRAEMNPVVAMPASVSLPSTETQFCYSITLLLCNYYFVIYNVSKKTTPPNFLQYFHLG